jgi:hypothetical protein
MVLKIISKEYSSMKKETKKDTYQNFKSDGSKNTSRREFINLHTYISHVRKLYKKNEYEMEIF